MLTYPTKVKTDFIFAGVAGLIVGHPADTIKVRQQAFIQGDGPLKTFKRTWQYEGVSTNQERIYSWVINSTIESKLSSLGSYTLNG